MDYQDMDIIRFGRDVFTAEATGLLQATIVDHLSAHGTITVGLSGGSTPVPVYAALSRSTDIDWSRVTFFLIDERYVPADALESNQRMIRETLLQGTATKATLISPDTSLPIDQCIAQYDQAISQLTPDLVILGMGEDGHIASLFPPLPEDAFGPANVIHTTTDTFAVHDRISVTLPVLKKASQRFFLIAGEKKRAFLETMQQTKGAIGNYPAKALFDKRTTWICREM